MDFWAQHKDFILKVLAGLGIFLVILIARGITYGDDLEDAMKKNRALTSKIKKLKIAPISKIRSIENNAERLAQNVKTISGQIGFDAADDSLEVTLIQRTLGYTRRFAPQTEAERATEARAFLGAIRDNLNGGFGQLRLLVREELLDEGNELDIVFHEGIGFQNLTQVKESELLQYLLQLELAARVARYALDARVDTVRSMRITTGEVRDLIPGANPDFLREYVVKIEFIGDQKGLTSMMNRLEDTLPRVTVRHIRVDRLRRPVNHIQVQLEVMATAINTEVPFKQAEVEEK